MSKEVLIVTWDIRNLLHAAVQEGCGPVKTAEEGRLSNDLSYIESSDAGHESAATLGQAVRTTK